MCSVKQKREIADKVQKILRETNHPELPTGEIEFALHVSGAEDWSWADIQNNGRVKTPGRSHSDHTYGGGCKVTKCEGYSQLHQRLPTESTVEYNYRVLHPGKPLPRRKK